MRSGFSIEQLLARAFTEEQLREIALTLEKVVTEFVESFRGFAEHLGAVDQALYDDLLEYSWFVDGEIDPDVVLRVAGFVLSKDENAVDREMMGHFRERSDAIQTELVTRHPTRAIILEAAFAAHREGKHELSVPVFLAQADGISRELLGEAFFQRAKSGGKAEKLLEEMTDGSYLESALRALIPVGTLRKQRSEVKPGEFNRHDVLHGFDTDYGSERNSLKAVSLLCFMRSMLEQVTESRRRRAVSVVPVPARVPQS